VVREVDDYERVLRLVRAELGEPDEGGVRDPVDPRAFASTATRAAGTVSPH
jgi:hypothetical protein